MLCCCPSFRSIFSTNSKAALKRAAFFIVDLRKLCYVEVVMKKRIASKKQSGGITGGIVNVSGEGHSFGSSERGSKSTLDTLYKVVAIVGSLIASVFLFVK
jgi:hypothetical protein